MVYYFKLFLNILDTFTNQSLHVTVVSATWSPHFFTSESPSWPTNSWQLWAGSENCPVLGPAHQRMLMSVVFKVETTDMNLGSVPAICLHRSAWSTGPSHDRSHNRRVTHYRSHPPLCLQKWHQPFKIITPEDNHDVITSVRSTCRLIPTLWKFNNKLQ